MSRRSVRFRPGLFYCLIIRAEHTDRFGERSNDLDEFWATDGLYWFGDATEHMVETATTSGPKRSVKGARGVADSSPMVRKPSVRRSPYDLLGKP